MIQEIKIFIIKDSKDDAYKIFSVENKNSLLYVEDEKYYLNSKYNGNEEIKFSWDFLKFDDDLLLQLTNLLDNAFKIAKDITKENISQKQSTHEDIKSILISKIEKGVNKKYDSIFHFIADIFCSLLSKHTLVNGNKRFALSFLITSLRFFGYHFYYSIGEKKNYQIYEKYLIDLVERLESIDKTFDEFDKIVLNESLWIKGKCVIAIQFRKFTLN